MATEYLSLMNGIFFRMGKILRTIVFFDQIACYLKEKLYLCIVILKRVARKGVLNCT